MSRIGDAFTSVTVPAASVDYALSESSDNFLNFYIIGYKFLPAAEYLLPCTADGVLHLHFSSEVCMISNPCAVLSNMQISAALGLLPRLRYTEVRRYVISDLAESPFSIALF